MQLEPGERSILASFSSGPDAEAALTALKEAGFSEAQLDRIDPYGPAAPDTMAARPAAIAGDESSLVRAVLGALSPDDRSRVLLGASPEASGLSGPITDIPPFLVTVVTTDDRTQEAVRILQNHGGRV